MENKPSEAHKYPCGNVACPQFLCNPDDELSPTKHYPKEDDTLTCVQQIAALESSLAAAIGERDEARKERYETTCRHCPECGSYRSEHGVGLENSHRGCLDCGQEWFTDVNYPTICQGNKAALKAANAQIAEDVARMDAATKVIERLTTIIDAQTAALAPAPSKEEGKPPVCDICSGRGFFPGQYLEGEADENCHHCNGSGFRRRP